MNSMINTAQFSIELSYKWPTLVTFDIFKVESPLSSTLNMIYYTFDPQFGSLVFSIYSRYERCGLSVIPDAFSLATLSQPSSVLAYAHTVGLQLVAIGEYYASFLSQVRAGSVIFLVGLGSFVCWKIWDYCCNEEEASIAKKKGSSSPKTPQNRLKITRNPKEFFSAWTEEEFVDDFNNLQEEDPTLIQGKYFGPDEAVENELRLSNVSSPNFILQVNGNNVLKQRIDSARSIHNAEDDGAGSLTSDGDDESFGGRQLPLSIARKTRRTKKRHRRSSYKKNEPFNPMYKRELVVREHVYDSTSYTMPYHRFHPYEYDVHRTVVDISSSETSPRIAAQRSESSKLLWRSHLASFQKRCEGDGSETPEWDESSARKSSPHIPQPTFTCEKKDANDGRLQPDGEEQCTSADQKSLTTDVSMEDILERMRSQSSHKSSWDNSSTRTSNRFLRDDSIMSYLSDLNTSDCSELSLEFSAIEDSFAEHTIISFDDIEEELNTLKSSMHEMDQEYEKHAARPNPYLLKTTLSDLSVDSDDSLSGNSVAFSPLISKPLKSLSSIDVKTVQQEDAPGLSKSSKHRSGSNKSLRSLRGSVDFELPQEDWLLWKKNGDRRRGSSTETSSKFSQDEHPSLEWDNSCCLKQYEEENPTDKTKEDDALKFLPDHTSLELDLEMELQSPSDVRSPKLSAKKFFWGASLNTPITPFVNPTNFGNLDGAPFNILGPIPFPFQSESPPQSIEPVCYPKRSIDPPSSLDLGVTNRWSMPGDYMMTSVDSAVHSGPASRSGSSTPRQLFSQSMMRYEMYRNVDSLQKVDFRLLNRFCKCYLLDNPTYLDSSLNSPLGKDEDGANFLSNTEFLCQNNKIKPGTCNPCTHCKQILTKIDIMRVKADYNSSNTTFDSVKRRDKGREDINGEDEGHSKAMHLSNRDSAINLSFASIPEDS